MRYFELSHATDKKIIGKEYPQCLGIPNEKLDIDGWLNKPNSFSNLNNKDFPDFEPEFLFELEEKSKLTDVVSPSNISAIGFLVNQKVIDILSNFKLMEYRVYPATLVVNKKRLNYFWLHFKENREFFISNIDYKNTTFYIRNMAFKKIEDIDINSYQEYLNINQSLAFGKDISVNNLIFNEVLNNEKYDLFFINSIFLGIRISEKLKEKIIESEITGFNISEKEVMR